ncbi:toll-like receptor 6 isoform X3 [Acropora palmata]
MVNNSALCERKKKTDPSLIRQVRVTFRKDGNASRWNVHWTPIEDYAGTWNGYCLNYVVGKNRPITDTKTSFVLKNMTSVDIRSSGDGKFLNVAVFGLSVSANETVEIKMYPFGPTEVAPASHRSIQGLHHYNVAFVPISIGIVFGVILVGCLMWYFSHRKKEYPPLPYDFRYHAFIIYSHQDSRWMRKQLLPLLEEKHHLTCCIHYKDFIPGKPIRDNMTDSVYTSYKVIALFSKNFINSSCCMYELDVAVNRLVQKRDNSLAIIRIDGADWKRLPAELRGRCFIDYHYPQERPFWGQRLLKFLDLPEEIRRQSTSEEHITDNNNDESNCNDEK